MEFSQFLGSREEYSGTRGSESGWTSYIASPFRDNYLIDDDNDDDHIADRKGYCRKGNYTSGGDSDDSMASDASSGPSHPELPSSSNVRRVGLGPSKDETSKSKERLQKKVKQRKNEARIKAEKKDSVIKAKSAASHVQDGTKVTRSRACPYYIIS